ncbi:SurA N-terminal domain-containing protein [Uliginosibacterium sp. sgz301328]|uniref:SurA N-terminal domain-containing protein n=1 Tax=Uliginosibacterium sp. sgz301328 TaxID=3243764 RepID=UPI00359E1651
MFEAVRNNPKFVRIALMLIVLPFAFFGIGSYVRDMTGDSDIAAKVGSIKITNGQLNDAVRTQQQNLREQMGASFSQEQADSPEFRQAVLDSLITQATMEQAIRENRLAVADLAVQNVIRGVPNFQENGKFSQSQYEAVLAANGLTPAQYEQGIRSKLAQQMLLSPITQTAVTPKDTLRRLVLLQEEERTIAEWTVNTADYMSKVTLADGAAKAFYDAHQADFRVPERIKVEYVVLSQEAIASQIKVSEEDARKWYDEHKDKYQAPEERRASHILVKVDANAPQAERDAARKKAEEILAKAKAKPEDFAALAKQYSDDPSGQSGGDLGFMERGAFVKPFDDALFALKPHQISDVVQSEYGYHIILLNDVRGGTIKPFEAVKADIVAEVTRDLATKRFAEASDQFGNMVYEQSDTFKPVAEKFGLKIEQSDWIVRGQAGTSPVANERVLSKLFEADSLKNRRNIEAVDMGNGVMVSARVVDHQAATQKPFEQVKAQIEERLTASEAAKLAQADGEAKLAKLKAGEAIAASWGAPRSVKRSTPGFSADARKAVFAANADKLPAFAGAVTPMGFTLYRIDKVVVPTIADNDPRLADANDALSTLLGEQDTRDYLAGLRKRMGVETKAKPAVKDEKAATN